MNTKVSKKEIIVFYLVLNFRKDTRNHFKHQGFGERIVKRTLEECAQTSSIDYIYSKGQILNVCTNRNSTKLKRLLSLKTSTFKQSIFKETLHVKIVSTSTIKEKKKAKSVAFLHKKHQDERTKRGCKKFHKQLMRFAFFYYYFT